MSTSDMLNSNYVKWMDSREGDTDIVISSRVRLARNISKIPFPHLLDQSNGEKCIEQITDAWKNSKDNVLSGMDMLTFNNLSSRDREILVEKHLTSPAHAESNSKYRAVLTNNDGSLSTMVNEEDHLRIQCLLPGLQVEDSYALCQELDDNFEAKLNYAFDEKRGYLTACPTNVGTGLRASVMLHLPAIQMTGQTNHIFNNIGQLGMTVRGIYGEGTEVVGNFFQLSNQVTLGQTEEDICNYLQTITEQVVEQERVLRTKLQKDMKYQLEDKIGRAYGILSNARVISSQEALALLSDVRLGVDLGILKGIKPFTLNQLVVGIRPAHLQRTAGIEMDAVDRDIKRAEVIKEKLKNLQ